MKLLELAKGSLSDARPPEMNNFHSWADRVYNREL